MRLFMNKPKPGEFYYHFKHDPEKGVNDHAYEIMGISIDTETEAVYVIYRPCYQSEWLKERKGDMFHRPLVMFMETVEKDSYTGPRFILITDLEIIEQIKNSH
jgi:hypothetical protein